MTTAAPVIDYRGRFRFRVRPESVWDMIERTGEFEQWWHWLGDFHLEGDGLRNGSVLIGVVSPPVPYQMRVRVELRSCRRPSFIEADVHGDLEGQARLDLTPAQEGTSAEVWWRIEMMQRAMRIASRFAHPVLRWGHDRVVDATVIGFRRQLRQAGLAP